MGVYVIAALLIVAGTILALSGSDQIATMAVSGAVGLVGGFHTGKVDQSTNADMSTDSP